MLSLFALTMLAVNLGSGLPDTPAREPQIAVSGANLGLTFGAGAGIYFSSSADSGKTFSTPVKVSEGGIVALNRHRGPRIAMSGQTVVITAVVGRRPAPGPHAYGLSADGDLMAWISKDGGRHWSLGVAVNDVGGSANEGLHALAMNGRGELFAAWLDKRGGRGTKLYGARSLDSGRTWSKNILIYESPDGTICECCHPSIAFDRFGAVLVMWRNWLGGSRDMYLARSRDGVTFSKAEKLGTGTWHLNACPMDGGGIAVAGNQIVTVWRREHSIYLASPGGKEVTIGDGTDVAIAWAANGVYAIWSSAEGVQILEPGRKESIAIASSGAFPAIVALPRGHALATWEDGRTIRIQTLP